MSFKLADANWNSELQSAVGSKPSSIRIVCPFIKRSVVERLLKPGRPTELKVITRFALKDFYDGVSDLSALRLLLDNGAMIRGVRNLHAKIFLFGSHRAIVGSANLTDAAMFRNHEFGFVADDPAVCGPCRTYFDGLWGRAGGNVTRKSVDEWDRTVTARLLNIARPGGGSGFDDFGVDAGPASAPAVEFTASTDVGQAFVKFFGESRDRTDPSELVVDELMRSGSHWACSYPKGKRPRQVQSGARMYMARIVDDPNDIMIFGSAIGLQHTPGRDDASPADLARRPWKVKWPHYIRVHHPEFVAGTIGNGVSLNQLMKSLGSDSFVSTKLHALEGSGNTEPRRAYLQKPAVALTSEAVVWLNERLEAAYVQHGKLQLGSIRRLDWPKNVPLSG